MARDFALSIDVGFHMHPKTLRFSRLMGSEMALGALIKLWSWATEAAPDGDIRRYEGADIEWAIGHRGADGKCFRALCDAGFIDHENYAPVAIHDWMEPGHTGYALVQQKAARDRWRRNKGLPVGSARKSRERPRGTSEESTGTPAPSRFTVHGENPPPARDPGATGYADAHDGTPAADLTQDVLLAMWKGIRDYETGTDSGHGTGGFGISPERIRDGFERVIAEPDGPREVRASMRRFWRSVKAGTHAKASECARKPALAWACWLADFHSDLLVSRGAVPVIPSRAAGSGATGPPRNGRQKTGIELAHSNLAAADAWVEGKKADGST